MRWWSLTVGLLALSCFNLYWRWPADTGMAHWSEWLLFYGSTPFTFALIWLAIAGAIRRRKVKRGLAPKPLSAFWPWLFALIMLAPGWLAASNTGPRRFVAALLALAY